MAPCHNGSCILARYLCDGHNQCGDWSDEDGCTPLPLCPGDDFRCWNGGLCVPSVAVCNGMKNCPDGSDEIDCPNGKYIIFVADVRGRITSTTPQ